MASWVLQGLRTGVRSNPYPGRHDASPGVSPGRPLGGKVETSEDAASLVARCPTGAIAAEDGVIAIDQGKCVHCYRCHADDDVPAADWEPGYEWAAYAEDIARAHEKLGRAFHRSLHIRFVDAGACGACISEARQLNSPYYNMHRLGFFITPTPRNADVLLVAGPVSDAMRTPLLQAWQAMPTPKRVVAIGACAISGGVFGPSFAAAGGVAEVIPVDIVVPGCPPPPLAILHALLVVVERKPPAALISVASGPA
jgi:Ni,Fe-hydrogenase III small subunit